MFMPQESFFNYLRHAVSWSIIHSPRNVTVHGAGDSNVKMTCAIVQDCTISPNPWFSHDGVQVENSTVKGIHVNHKSVDGTKATVVEWELAFTNLTQKEIFSNYTCRASPSIAAIARLEKAGEYADHLLSWCTTGRLRTYIDKLSIRHT